MTRQEIETQVNTFLHKKLMIEESLIYPNSRLKEDMGINSLDYIDIVVNVEKVFGYKITDPSELSPVKTLAQFYDFI